MIDSLAYGNYYISRGKVVGDQWLKTASVNISHSPSCLAVCICAY